MDIQGNLELGGEVWSKALEVLNVCRAVSVGYAEASTDSASVQP